MLSNMTVRGFLVFTAGGSSSPAIAAAGVCAEESSGAFVSCAEEGAAVEAAVSRVSELCAGAPVVQPDNAISKAQPEARSFFICLSRIIPPKNQKAVFMQKRSAFFLLYNKIPGLSNKLKRSL